MVALKAIALILIILGATATTGVAYVINPQPFEVGKARILGLLQISYVVCTYVNPNNIGAKFSISEILGASQIVGDGGIATVKTDGTVYQISPYSAPSGYMFQSWSTQRSVTVTSPTSSTTTVTFSSSGWDGSCIGALVLNLTPSVSTPYPLSVSTGSGGSVSGTASGSYTAGTSISVTATPSSGSYRFSSWSISGASCSGGASVSPCTFSMPSNAVTLVANFVPVQTQTYYVCTYVTPNNIGGTFTISGIGTVGDGGRVAVAIDTTYPISPTTVPSNYKFGSWSTQRSVTVASQTSASTTVTFGSSGWDGYCVGSLVLNLVPSGTSTYSLTVSAGSGGTTSGTPSGSYAAGTPISVTANPSSGYKFSSWSISGASCAGGTASSPCAFSMPSNAVSLTANFAVVTTTYAFTVSTGSGGSVSGTASGSYTAGTSISVTASPSSGYKFSSWSISGASCSGGSSASPCAFSMPSNAVTVTANFIVILVNPRYVCTYVVPDYAGAGIVIGGVGTYYGQGYERAPITADGRTYTLSVILPSGVTFVKWGTQRSVSVANPNSASTTVSFTETGWDGECVGALQLYVNIPPVAGCETLPLKIHDSGKWEWWISDAETCASYLQHKAEIDLFKPYPDSVTTWLSNNLGQMENFPKVSLKLTPPGGRIYASGTEIGIPTDAFYGDYQGIHSGYAYVLIAHETMNLYTGNAVSGGWPYDWWADGRSPFPLTTGMKACIDLNWRDSKAVCQTHLNNYAQQDSLVAMFQSLYMGYGNGMFSRAFSAAKSDGINWENIGANPSALRTNYVTAYLTIGAGGDLTSMFSGKVPNFDPTVTMNIKQARTNLQTISRSDSRWTEYLHGNYAPALQGGTTIVANFAYKSAGQPDWTSASQGDSIKVVSPTQFKVTIIQGAVYGVRVVVDGAPYTLTTSGSNTYLATLNLSSASHVIRFEYQGSSGGSWGPLGLLDTQSQETGLAGMFTAFVALVLGNWLVSSGLMLALLAVAIVIVWRRRH